MVIPHNEERVVKLPFEYARMKLLVAQKSYFESMNTDSNEFTSASSTEKEGSEEWYFVRFAGNFLEQAQRDELLREKERSTLLASKVSYLGVGSSKTFCQYILESYIIVWSTKDLSPAEVPVRHFSELTNESPILNRLRSMAPKRNEIVRKEIIDMLEARIVVPASSAWSFPVVIATNKMEN